MRYRPRCHLYPRCLVPTGGQTPMTSQLWSSDMTAESPADRGAAPPPVAPAAIVRVLVRPLTKILNPLGQARRPPVLPDGTDSSRRQALREGLRDADVCSPTRRRAADRAHLRQSVRLVAQRPGRRRV